MYTTCSFARAEQHCPGARCVLGVSVEVWSTSRTLGQEQYAQCGEKLLRRSLMPFTFPIRFPYCPYAGCASCRQVALAEKWPNLCYSNLSAIHTGASITPYLKPLLRYITTINFGQLIHEDWVAEFFHQQAPGQCQLDCVEHEVIKDSVDMFIQAA